MADQGDAFPTHKAAALAVLNAAADLRQKEGQFLGGIAFSDDLTPKQRHWLEVLLDRHGLPALADGGQQ